MILRSTKVYINNGLSEASVEWKETVDDA